VLLLELEWEVVAFEESQARAVLHLEENVQGIGAASGPGLTDFKGVDHGQAQEILIEFARLLSVLATISVVV